MEKPLKLIILLVGFCLSPSLYAADHNRQLTLPLTTNTAAELVHNQTGGKVLSITQSKQNERSVFHVKVLHNDGKVKIYNIDAATGKPVS